MIPENTFQALKIISEKLNGKGINWVLIGSTNHALQGVDVKPNDIDILTDKEGAYAIGEALKEYVIEEVHIKESETMKSHYGKFNINDVEVEILNSPFNSLTGIDGRYNMASIPGGMYDSSFTHPYYYDTIVHNLNIIEGDTLILDIEMNSNILTGIVTDFMMTPVENVITTITNTGFVDTTDAIGHQKSAVESRTMGRNGVIWIRADCAE